MAQGTLWPVPIQRALDADGNPVAGALLSFFLAGTTTPVAVYHDVLLTTAWTQPIAASGSGVFDEIYLTPGTSYKITMTTPGLVNLPGYPADNVPSTPGSSGNVDVPGVFGEAVTAGQGVYLSDGSGGKTPGLWYKWDSANAYSSTAPAIGMVLAPYAANDSGTIRQTGQVTGLSGLTAGTSYFVGTAGALTATQPSNGRFVGVADTTSSIVLGNPSTAGLGFDFLQLEAFL